MPESIPHRRLLFLPYSEAARQIHQYGTRAESKNPALSPMDNAVLETNQFV